MKNFWSYISNGKHSVGCTGQTVYIYDSNGKELAKFKDIIYAYKPVISPDGNLLAVKSTDGRFAIYSLEEMKLIKKFRYSKVNGGQDDDFCFSRDGKYIINLECQQDCLHHGISVYDTENFERKETLFTGRTRLSSIECDDEGDGYYVLGSGNSSFIAKYENNELKLKEKASIPDEEFEFYRKFKGLELMGFTEKAFEWSYMDCRLEGIKDKKYPLKELYLKNRRT